MNCHEYVKSFLRRWFFTVKEGVAVICHLVRCPWYHDFLSPDVTCYEREYLGWWSKTQVLAPHYYKMDVWFKKIRDFKIRKQSSSSYLICLFIIFASIHWFIPSFSLLILIRCLLNIRHWMTLKLKMKNKSRPWIYFRNCNI